jgi:hypothetical protein
MPQYYTIYIHTNGTNIFLINVTILYTREYMELAPRLRAKAFASFHILIIGEYLYYFKNLKTKKNQCIKCKAKSKNISV